MIFLLMAVSLFILPSHIPILLYYKAFSIIFFPFFRCKVNVFGSDLVLRTFSRPTVLFLLGFGILDVAQSSLIHGYSLLQPVSQNFFLLLSPLIYIWIAQLRDVERNLDFILYGFTLYILLSLIGYLLLYLGIPSLPLLNFLSHTGNITPDNLLETLTRNTESSGRVVTIVLKNAALLSAIIPILLQSRRSSIVKLLLIVLILVLQFLSIAKIPLALSLLYIFLYIFLACFNRKLSFNLFRWKIPSFTLSLLAGLTLVSLLHMLPTNLISTLFQQITTEIFNVIFSPFSSSTLQVRSQWLDDLLSSNSNNPLSIFIGHGTGGCFFSSAYGGKACIKAVESSFFDIAFRMGYFSAAMFTMFYGATIFRSYIREKSACASLIPPISSSLFIILMLSIVNPFWLSILSIYLLLLADYSRSCPR
jgi:hypothetical protein